MGRRVTRWVPVAEAARTAGIPVHRMRRRLRALNDLHGGGLLRRFSDKGQAWLYVDAAALDEVLRTERLEDRLSEVRAQLSDHERKLAVLRSEVARLRRRTLGRRSDGERHGATVGAPSQVGAEQC